MSKKIVLILVAIFAMGFMSLSLNASEMKCGAGKCGSSMSKDMNANGCTCKDCDNEKCAHKLDPKKACDCKHDGKMKCGAGKCGSSDKKMKCGAGKCGK